MDPVLRRLLEIRVQLSKASTSKFKAYLARVQDDGCMRDLLMYHGASTGRWTAKGVQIQNLPSRGLALEKPAEVEEAIGLARAGLLAEMYENPFAVAASCLRGMITAGDLDHLLYYADYSAIEGRILAWRAGDSDIVAAYVANLRMYCVAASGVFGVPALEIDKGRKTDARMKFLDSVGKVIELACGYQGGVGAFRAFETNLGLNLNMTDAEVKDIVTKWRAARPGTTALWNGLEDAAFGAVSNPGTMTSYGPTRFKVVGKFLLMRIPSGRLLYYFDPAIVEKLMPWKDKDGRDVYRDVVSYWGVDSQTKKWVQCFGYGGLWTENEVQALARDIMRGAMLRLAGAGWHPRATVHDEIISRERVGFGSAEEMERIMCEGEPWSAGLPLTASVSTGFRYSK